MLRHLAASAAVAAALAICAPASAQYGGPEQIQPTRSALWAELGFFTGSAEHTTLLDPDSTVLTALLAGYVGITDALEIAFQWGVAFADVDVFPVTGVMESESSFGLGNPMASLRYIAHLDDADLRLGLGITLPVADAPDGASPPADELARAVGYQVAASMSGLWDLWLWTPDRVTFVVPQFRLGSTKGDFVWAVVAAMGLMVDTSDADRDVEVPVQAAVEGGGRLGRSFVVGGRLQAVWIPTLPGDADALQLAFEPFARVELENAFLFSKLTINLDEPNGFSFDEGKVWGLHIGGGTRF